MVVVNQLVVLVQKPCIEMTQQQQAAEKRPLGHSGPDC